MTDQPTGAAPQPAATIRDSIKAAMTELEPEADAGGGEAAAGGGGEGSAAAETTGTGAARSDNRDPATGRFIKREGEEAPAETATPKAAKEEKPPAEAKKPEGEQKPADKAPTTDKPGEAPQHWSAEDKAWLATFPPEHRQAVIDRFKKIEAGFAPKLQRAAALEKDYGPVDEYFTPHVQAMTQQGWTKASLIKAWADVELALAKDPYAQIREIAKHYGVDLRKLAGVEGAAAAAAAEPGKATLVSTDGQVMPSTDPAVKALQEELQKLSRTVNGFTEAEQRRAVEQQTAATQQTLTEIRAFAEAKGEDGNPSHPLFNDVMADMIRLAQAERAAGRVPKLQDLYDTAVWANPQTRAAQIAATEEKAGAKARADAEAAQRKQAEEAKARAERARKAGSSVTGAPSGTGQASTPKSKGSLRQDIIAAAEELGGG